jgi:PPM family protein phosphatase
MLCANCNLEMPPDNVFCEECGVRLAGAADEPEATPEILTPCARCGAPASQADEEGYCRNCGFRREKPREHSEIAISEAFAGVTDQGKRHSNNEDSMAIAEYEGTKILLVCDGVSSSQNASSASRTAADAAMKAVQSATAGTHEERLREAFREAWRAVSELPYSTGEEGDPPSTTFVGAIVGSGRATIAWAGDSRAYWIGADSAESKQLTLDDSWLNDVVGAGEMSYEEALRSSQAHAITKWIGADAGEPEPGILEFEFPQDSGGMLLLCSDGLWNYCETPEGLRELAAGNNGGGAIAIARRYIDYANSQGGRDNITAAVLLHMQETPAPEPVEVASSTTPLVPVEAELVSATPPPVPAEPQVVSATTPLVGAGTPEEDLNHNGQL